MSSKLNTMGSNVKTMNSNRPTQPCYHCQLPIMVGDNFSCELAGAERAFCCPACKAVAQTIHAGGMASFYQFQEAADQRPDATLLDEQFTIFDSPEFQQRFVKQGDDTPEGEAKTELLIGGVHCAACVWLLEQQLSQLGGLVSVSVSLTAQKALISWQPQQLSLSKICQSIAAIGYEPEPYHHDQLVELQQREQRTALRRLGIAGIGMMQAGMFAIALYAGDLQYISDDNRNYMRAISLLVASVVVFYSARSFFTGAWQGLKKAKPVMDLPVAIAIGLAYGASIRATVTGSGEVYFDSVTMFTFLLLAGRYLEMRARHYHGRLSSNLQSLLPSTATLLIDNEGNSRQQHTVPLFNVKQGDILLIKPGHTIPADGIITDGESNINEAQLTGEFTPLHKSVGDPLIAGTINMSNPIHMQVTATGAKLQLESIAQLVNQGQHSKPRIAELADRLSLYFITAILIIASGTYATWLSIDDTKAFWVTLSVLVVSCPCALSLATPAAITAASHRLRQLGVFVAKAQLWESLPTIEHIVFDKTGTLTKGLLSVKQTVCASGYNPADTLRIAAMLENGSEHPIAQAFREYSQSQAEHVKAFTNQGMEGDVDGVRYRIGKAQFASNFFQQTTAQPPHNDGQQWILLSNTQGPCAWFQLSDPLRDDTQSTLQKLRAQGFELHLLSGDSSGSAESIGQQLGFNHCKASASPEDKLNYIQTLQQQGPVMMLGDGINDIPVLAAANVSVAMSNAPDVAKTQADCILLSGRLSSVLNLFDMAKRTQCIIRQNLGWALLYNAGIIPLAAQGLIPPYLAAIGMSLSSLFVLLNALRLHKNNELNTPTAQVNLTLDSAIKQS